MLFQPHIKLQKYGTIGAFWEKPKKSLWKEIAEGEQRIADALERPEVQQLVNHIHELLGESIPIEKIERSIGTHSETPAIERWIEQLALDDHTIE